MDIREIRRRQLQKLVSHYGGQTALAEAAGKDQTYISRILNAKPSNPESRRMGETWAREVERNLKLPHLYFDSPDMEPGAAPRSTLQDELDQLPPGQRRVIEQKFKDLLEVFRREPEADVPRVADEDVEDTGRWRLTRDKDVSHSRKRRGRK